jgi:penicillin G amidase
MVRRALKLLVILLAFVLVSMIAGGVYLRSQMRGSLAQLDGTASVPGLAATARVDRDALGVPAITGSSRDDVARALGFLHAQDRFFQMDLQRRQPAGELSELVGPRAMDVDAAMRVHRFRDVARRAYQKTGPAYRRVLDAYTAGVNAGLDALAAPPFEYLVLRTAPEPWQPEDSILTVLAMFNTLQGRQVLFEQTLGAMRDALPEPMFRFLSTTGSVWDTPVVGGPTPRPPIPSVAEYRTRREGMALSDVAFERQRERNGVEGLSALDPEIHSTIGSNNWAVSGAHTASGGALVANDMHLSIAVPIIWYRASFAFPDPQDSGVTQRITGVTLPGLPSMVVGSNGHVAWGFTNTGGDWSDLIRLDPDPRDPAKYLTPDGPKTFQEFDERIVGTGAIEKTVRIRWTIWGPVVWTDAKGREYAQRWIAHDAELLASDTTRPERARTVDQLIDAVAGLGIPNQNVTMADSTGRVAWTIGGAIPRRVGHDGLTPQSWADGSHRWDGYLSAAEFPRIVDPQHGRIWTANAPVVDGAMLAAVGEGGYADGIRARLIRERLMQIDRATAEDMLSIQLEDRALFLERWRELLLETIRRSAEREGGPERAEFRRLVDTTWTGRASSGSVSYRLVRAFRMAFVRDVMTTLTAPAKTIDPAFDYSRSLRGEGPVWQLIAERPVHLLDPRYRSWDEHILAVVDQVIAELTEGGRALHDRTWGEANAAQILHPLASAIPFFGGYLNMPGDPLPGDIYTPRASTPRTGPSERMVVSPGREHEGIMQIPTGQSGHPLSPHYGDQYRAWLFGEPTPFLPGPAVSTLTLKPLSPPAFAKATARQASP